MKVRIFQFRIPNPEYQIRDCSTGPVFCEEKESKINSEEALLIHSKFIGEHFISITRKIRNDGVFLSKSQATNLKDKEGFEEFNNQWEDGWDKEEARKSEEIEINRLGSKEFQIWEDLKKLWQKIECVAFIYCQAKSHSDILNEARVEEEKNGICEKIKRFFRMK